MSPSYPAARDCSRTPTLEIFRTSADACDQCWRLPFCSVCIPDPEFLSFPGVWPSPLLMAAVNFAIGSDFNIEGMASGRLVGFRSALWLMATLLAVIFVAGLVLLPRLLGKAKSSKSMRELFAKTRSINLLAAARVFMFGARDVWFVVGLPVFLYAHGWRFLEVGGFLAACHLLRWHSGHRSFVVRRSADGLSSEIAAAHLWAAILALIPVGLAIAMYLFAIPGSICCWLRDWRCSACRSPSILHCTPISSSHTRGRRRRLRTWGSTMRQTRRGAFWASPYPAFCISLEASKVASAVRRDASGVLGDHLRFTRNVEHAGSPIGSWRGRGISGWSGFGPARNAGVKARRRFPSAPAR